MKTSDFDYNLPIELISQIPKDPRDSSRLLVLDRSSGQMEHTEFTRLGHHLRPGDLLVLNDSRVISSRVIAQRNDGDGFVEFLLLRRLETGIWQAIGKPGRWLKPGASFSVGTTGVEIQILRSHQDGMRIIHISQDENIQDFGEMPLPPYIKRRLTDPERYQTIYSREDGSAAAPTAGLHFTRDMLDSLSSQGIAQAYVTLHIGLDTFRPVRAVDPKDHQIHSEYFRLDEAAANDINMARHEGRRIIAVGTTSVRVLEQTTLWAEARGTTDLVSSSGWAKLFILPGHRFRLINAMITNFHLPQSSTLMLTAAFAGWDNLIKAYHEAIEREYAFYSFGDAMLVI